MFAEEFDRRVHQLQGMRLRQVRYYEHPGTFPAWREIAVLDSISYGVDLIGEDRSFCVTWDNAVIEYGLTVYKGTLLDQVGATLVTNVTNDSRWSALVGQRISQVQVHWHLTLDGPLDESEKYPQSIELLFEQGDVVLMSAALPLAGTQTLTEASDNIVVLFGEDAIRTYSVGSDR